MSEDADHDEEADAGGEGGTDPVWDRSTAPQSDYTASRIAIGVVVLVVGLVVTFGLPLALV